ncbi:MAG: hypothetical protein WC938_03595 [Candidatus Paceibacterota bacterium]|jgi:hypothetical protein
MGRISLNILKNAAGEYPILTISRIQTEHTNILQIEPESSSNIYWQVLQGAKLATTEYIAVAEDDTLYTKEHFTRFRPENTFGYNMTRWTLYTWGEPIYSLKNFIRTNAVLIAPRKLVIEALEERFAKYPHDMKNIPSAMAGELGYYESRLGVTPRKVMEFKTIEPVVQFDHDYFTGDNSGKGLERRHTKELGTIRAYDIPIWRKAEDLVKKFK